MRYHARLPPSASISFYLIRSPLLSFSRRPLIPVLRVASFFARRIQFFRRREGRNSQSSPPTSRTSRTWRSHIDFDARHSQKHSFTAFQYHALTRPPDTSLRVIRAADGEASSYQSLPLDRIRAAAGSRELSSEHGDSGEANDED